MDPAQRAQPGAPIDENVAFFNERFYAAAESNQNYHLLLHDFEKAFDRTSRHYLLPLLRLPLASLDIEFRAKLTPNDRLTLLAFTCAVWKTRELRVWQSDLNLADATSLQPALLLSELLHSLPHAKTAALSKDRNSWPYSQPYLPISCEYSPDGSSYDALRAGAGFTVTCAKRRHQFGHSQLLGPATNNFAELTALTLAARYCATRVRDLPPNSRPPVFLLDRQPLRYQHRHPVRPLDGKVESPCHRRPQISPQASSPAYLRRYPLGVCPLQYL
jgi:hypothetical protein